MNDAGTEQHLVETINHGFTCQAILLGQKLALFDHLSQTPKTCTQIANGSNFKERYVLEWLKIMTVSGFIKYNEKEQTWWIPDSLKVLFEKESQTMSELSWLSMITGMVDKISDCFRKDGPLGTRNAEYNDFHKRMAEVSDKRHKKWLFKAIIPEVPGLLEKLEKGCEYLDIGCGSGMPCYLIAQRYPKVRCIGIDFESEAVETAKANLLKNKDQDNLSNVEYLQMDGSKLCADWTERFDFITTFDAIHDQAYPDKSLAEIFRVLKKGGIYSMIDIDAHSSVSQNKANPNAQVLYTMSLFHCMPVSLAEPGGMGLGAMWGREKATQMLEDSGFRNIVFRSLHDFIGHYHCMCQKI